MQFSADEAYQIGEKIGIDWDQVEFDSEALAMGMEVELEHGSKLSEDVNVTDDDPEATAQIAWAHLMEAANYYDLLAEMEELMKDVNETARERSAYQIEKKVQPGQEAQKPQLSEELENIVFNYTDDLEAAIAQGLSANDAFKQIMPDLDELSPDDLVNLLYENPQVGGRGSLVKFKDWLPALDIYDIVQKLLERYIWEAAVHWWGTRKTELQDLQADQEKQQQQKAKRQDDTATKVEKKKPAEETRDDTPTKVLPKEGGATFTHNGAVYREAVIRNCEQRDMDPDRPAVEQKVCLFTKDGRELLGRHPDEEAAKEQEAAIHAGSTEFQSHSREGEGNATMKKQKRQSNYIKLAEVPESAVKSLYDQKWGESIMKQLGEDFPIDSKAAQFLFHSVWNAVIQLMDKSLMGQEVDTTEFSQDPTFMQSLAGLAYFVADDAIKSSLGIASDSLQKGKGHAEALMAVLGKDADVDQTLESLKKRALPIVDKAFDQVTSYLKEESPAQKAASTTRTRAEVFCAFVRPAAFGDEDAEDWAEQPREYILRYTYCLVTPESAEQGDCAERGFVRDGYPVPLDHENLPSDEEVNMPYGSLAELVDDLEYDHSWLEWSGSPAQPGDWIISQEEEDFAVGEQMQYDAHVTHGDNSDLSEQEMQYIHDRLGLYGKIQQLQRELPLEAKTAVEAKTDEIDDAPVVAKQQEVPLLDEDDGMVQDNLQELGDELAPQDLGRGRDAVTSAKQADRMIRQWAQGLPSDMTGRASVWLYGLVDEDADAETWIAAVENEGLYIPAQRRDIPYVKEFLRDEMNEQLATDLDNATEAGTVGSFVYAEQQGQWGLMYETMAAEDVIALLGMKPKEATPAPPEARKNEARKTDRSKDHRPRGRDSRAPAMQLTQQLGQQPKRPGKRPQVTDEPEKESWVKRSLRWLEDKSKEAAAPRSRWGRLREADAKELDNRNAPGQAGAGQAGCGCRKSENTNMKHEAATIMHDPKYAGHGKFNTNVDEAVYEMVLDGWGESLGDVEELGHYDFLVFGRGDPLVVDYGEDEIYRYEAAIVATDNQGFVNVHYFDDQKEAEAAWAEVEAEYTRFYDEVEQENPGWY